MRRFWFTAMFLVCTVATSFAGFDYRSKTDEELGAIVNTCTAAIQAQSKGSFIDITESDVADLNTTRTLYPKSASMMLLDIPKRDVKKNAIEKLRQYGDDRELTFIFHGESDSFAGMVDWLHVYDCRLKDGKVEGIRKEKAIYLKQ